MLPPNLGIDIMHVLILKLILHTIRKQSDEDPSFSSIYWSFLADRISRSTFYRKIGDLERLGFISRISREKYILTLNGYLLLAFAYLSGIDAVDYDTFKDVIKYIKVAWGLKEFDDEEVEAYLRLLFKAVDKGGCPCLVFTNDFPKTLLLILPRNLNLSTGSFKDLISKYIGDAHLTNRASRVIAKALLEYCPTTVINGCPSVVILSNGELKVLAMKCSNNYILN